MRWVIRFFLLIVFAIGAVLALLYPWAADNLPGYELGKWRVYDRATGYTQAQIRAAPSETPVWVTVEVYSDGDIVNPDGAIVFTMTTSADDQAIRAETFTLQGMEPRILSPQSSERLYRFDPVRMSEVDRSPYVFVAGPGEDDFPVIAIDLVANASAIAIDPQVPVLGYVMMGITGFLLLLTFRRRRKNPNEMPPPPRWGRGTP
jgi:hypothetical protein